MEDTLFVGHLLAALLGAPLGRELLRLVAALWLALRGACSDLHPHLEPTEKGERSGPNGGLAGQGVANNTV